MPNRVLRPRRNHPSATPPVSRRAFRASRAFTLAELLIVIAIIGVLISILLPTLGAARRSANSAKCLAALRDLGLAFQQYAQDNRRAFPVVEYSPNANVLTPGSPARRPWQDFLVKYVHKKEPSQPEVKLEQYLPNSVLWGCPSFDRDNWFRPDVDAGLQNFSLSSPNKFNTGYGMSRWTLAPYGTAGPPYTVQKNATDAAGPGNLAMFRDAGTPRVDGAFFKMEIWGKRASERGLLADSNSYDLWGSATWSKAHVTVTPATAKCDPFMPAGTTLAGSYINVDGIRHVSATNNPKKVFATKGVNMLFVDGHATSVTPEEAWIATRGGGMDIRTP
jgi:prepilin-type N-terminal cleavage/methylation domain-containing protein/prepilin-type processing-associated H-X9-DG protein